MALFKCKMCGGNIEFYPGDTIGRCDSCGTRQTLPNLDDDKKIRLFERANRLRLNCEFDRAAGVYEELVHNFPDEAESYWGLILCRYGIEYVDDPATGRKVPTCHRSSYDSLLDDPDFEMVMETSEAETRSLYREEAKQIEEIRKRINQLSQAEAPYDIFICYKETDENGERTLDSVLAQELYDVLTADGYRVFFSRISLEDKLGTEYEPYIFAALNSARIMLAVGTSYEYYNAVWVKNEWSRYLKLIANDHNRHLIPCFKGIDAYDIPKEFRRFQAQDLGKVGATQDLKRGIEKLLGKHQRVENAGINRKELEELLKGHNQKDPASLLKRGFMALSDRDYETADGLFEEILGTDLENAEAYMGKLLVQCKCESRKALAEEIVKEVFPRKWKFVGLQFPVDQVLRKNFRYYDSLDPVSLAAVRNSHIKLHTNKDALQNADLGMDFLRYYLEKTDHSYSTMRLYEHFLEYADDELRQKYDVQQEACQLVNEKREAEEAAYHDAQWRCSEETFGQELRLIADQVEQRLAGQIKKQAEQLNYNNRQISALKSGGGGRLETRRQIAELKKKNEQLENLMKVSKNTREQTGSETNMSVGILLRNLLRQEGYVEDFPLGRPFVMGKWKDVSGDRDIRWKAIGKEDNYVLMITEDVIDTCMYAGRAEECDWNRSALRKFLNNVFYKKAFTDKERSVIVPVLMESSVQMNQDPDKVTCLSARDWAYYAPSMAFRETQFTAYAKKKLGRKLSPCFWCRDNGQVFSSKANSFMVMDCSGQIMNTANLMSSSVGVRPAIWIDIS